MIRLRRVGLLLHDVKDRHKPKSFQSGRGIYTTTNLTDSSTKDLGSSGRSRSLLTMILSDLINSLDEHQSRQVFKGLDLRSWRIR